ncbi:MAG: pantoate--beta-alanine ligase [Cyanobacteria bacterium SIG30]|nr:pantoate--beta-alanine ligase [Cyanobacteria bacterium SIG30]
MKVIKTIKELREILKEARKNKTIGLVPTMGALHLGHASLIKNSTKENDFTVVSIFVNPTQFGPNEDYNKYPRTLEADSKICEELDVDVIFSPSPDEMYADQNESTFVCPAYSDINKLCGKSRPGHFDGVATVVSKLFNIVKPDRAYFGEKDAQQLFIIKKMVRDLNFDIEIVPCPIIREKDGLALSSRNTYLNQENRKRALKLSKALFTIKEMSQKGIKNAEQLVDTALSILENEDVEYFEILDLNKFEKIDTISNESIALCAVKFPQENGTVRLIDNIKL